MTESDNEVTARCSYCNSEDIIIRHFTVDTHAGEVQKERIECRECGEDEVRMAE